MAKQTLVKVNKHCMTDGTKEYYRNERGDWRPGHYDGRRFIWDRTRRYSARKRTYEVNGRMVDVRLTRYTIKETLRPAYAPIGKNGKQYKKAYLQTVKDVYYANGTFYIAVNVRREDGTYYNSIKPLSGYIFDCYKEQSERAGIPNVAIWCDNGRPYSVELDGEQINIAPGEWESMYVPVLQIKDVEPTATDDAKTDDATETETDDNKAFNDARENWINSTTAAGEQIDLIAFFGYGDATWQNLAI